MKCAIEDCVNNDEDQAKSEGITYHMFPKDAGLCNTWLENLRISKFEAYYRRRICSKHFREEDFCITRQGKRNLKLGAVPYLDDCYGPAASRTCKICLTLDAKMYPLKNGLDKMYEDVMGIEPTADHLNRLPMAICWECTARLQSAAAFKSKALYCDELLQDHLLTNDDLKIFHIKRILKGQTDLQSSMAVQEVFKFNNLDDEDHEEIGIPNNEETEVELRSLVTDKITDEDERKTSIIVDNSPAPEFETEDDIIPSPISEVETDEDTNFDDYNEDSDNEMVTENNYVDNTDPDSANVSTNEENLTTAIDVSTNQEKIETNNDAMDLSEIMETNDEELLEMAMNLTSEEEKSGDSDDEGIRIQLKGKTVMCVKKGKKRKKIENISPKIQSTSVKPGNPIDENIFSMRPLDPDELRKEILARRDSARYKNSPFKCEICYKGFPTKEKRKQHVLKHSEKYGPLKCNICLIRVRNNSDLRAHFGRLHTTEYICKLCPLKTRIRSVALGHMNYHNGEKYSCPQCFLEFEKKTTFLNHLRRRHMCGFVCELCGFTFVSTFGVEVHKRMQHKLFDPNTEFTGPYCDVCEVKFLTEKAYNRHMRLSSKHITEDDPNRMSNDPSVEEPKQRRLYVSNVRRVRRNVIHRNTDNEQTSNGPIECEQCGVELENMRKYSLHFRNAHPGVNRTQFKSKTTPFMCEQCGKFFANSTTLSCHMWVHTGQKLFQCDHCNKTFTIKSNLVGHMRIHDGTLRYFTTCKICEKQFSTIPNLARHMLLHKGLKPFKCEACGKAFRTSTEQRAHVDHVHLKKPRPKRVRRRAKKSVEQTVED